MRVIVGVVSAWIVEAEKIKIPTFLYSRRLSECRELILSVSSRSLYSYTLEQFKPLECHLWKRKRAQKSLGQLSKAFFIPLHIHLNMHQNKSNSISLYAQIDTSIQAFLHPQKW